MVDSELLSNNVLILRPSGPISADDIAAVRQKVDPLLESGGHLAGIMIEADGFPGWEDFASLCDHLRFVRDHQKDVARVAFVSDSRFLTALPRLARHFLRAEFRQFEGGASDEALVWITGPPTEATTALRHGWFPDRKIIWIYVHGRVQTEAYRELVVWMEGILEKNRPVSFLIDVQDMEGVDLGAAFTDFKFGLNHHKDIHRVALVGNEGWTGRLAKLPNPFSCELKAFPESEESAAWEWASSR